MKANDFLLELGTEELPPKRLPRLMSSFGEAIAGELDKAQLAHGEIETFATPRRLAVIVRGLAPEQPEQSIERRGPAIKAAFDSSGTPTKAASGFASSCGVEVDQLERMETDRGTWLVFRDTRPGLQVSELIEGIVETATRALPVERPMHWGASRAEFVRPVHWVVMLYGKDVLPAKLFGLDSGRVTRGHRFMSSGEGTIKAANDYTKVLEAQHVIASFERRRSIIATQLAAIEKQQGVRVEADPDLLDEVTSLVEWPVSLCGSFDPAFLAP